MKKVTLILLTLLFSTGLFAVAFDPGPADQGKLGPQPEQRALWGRLNLTDDQKEKLRRIREADRESLRSAWAQVKIARETLKAVLLADPENIADVETKATNLANAVGTVSIQIAVHRAKINQVLTPWQRVELEESTARRMRGWERRGDGSREGPLQEPSR